MYMVSVGTTRIGHITGMAFIFVGLICGMHSIAILTLINVYGVATKKN